MCKNINKFSHNSNDFLYYDKTNVKFFVGKIIYKSFSSDIISSSNLLRLSNPVRKPQSGP